MQNLSIKECELLQEITTTLNAFSIMREFAVFILVGVSFLIGAIVAIALGETLFMLLIIGGGLLVEFIGLKVVDTKPNKSEFAYEVCLLMDNCLVESTEKYRKIGNTIVSSVSIYASNRDLYKKFVKVYPEMKSFKLWYLSSVKAKQF